MPYHTRNPSQRKRPRRFDDLDYSSSAAASSPRDEDRDESGANSRDSPELVELESPPPPKRTSRAQKYSYHGPITQYNPNVPRAVFPTLDQPRPAHSADQEELVISGPDSEEPEVTKNHPPERDRRQNSLQNLPAMFSAPPNNATAGLRPKPLPIPWGNTMASSAGSNLGGQGLGRNDNGPNNPTFVRNMEMIRKCSERTGFDRNMDDMKDSDEDEPPAMVVGDGTAPSWDDLSDTLKLDVGDNVNGEYDLDIETTMSLLLLSDLQKDKLRELVFQRTGRQAEEEENGKLLNEYLREAMLKGKTISPEENRNMMDQTIYRATSEDNHITATHAEVEKAKAYLQHCGLDPSILEWERPPSGVSLTQKTRGATTLAGIVESSDPDEGPSGSSPQLSTNAVPPSAKQREHPNPTLPKPKNAQAKDEQRGTSSRRGRKTFELIDAHSSPVPPHKVPSRQFPVAPTRPTTERTNGFSSRTSQQEDRGRSYHRANDMLPPPKRNPSSKLPTPPDEPMLPPTASGPAAGPAPVAAMNMNGNDTCSNDVVGINKRKRSSSGSVRNSAGLITPPVEPSLPPTSRVSAAVVAVIINRNATSSNGVGGSNKRKRSPGESATSGANGTRFQSAGTVDYPWAANFRPSTSADAAIKKTKKIGGSLE